MAYFANGSEGAVLEAQCDNCPLGAAPEGTDTGCEVLLIHLLYNYDQVGSGQEKLREAMSLLVDDKGVCRIRQRIEKVSK